MPTLWLRSKLENTAQEAHKIGSCSWRPPGIRLIQDSLHHLPSYCATYALLLWPPKTERGQVWEQRRVTSPTFSSHFPLITTAAAKHTLNTQLELIFCPGQQPKMFICPYLLYWLPWNKMKCEIYNVQNQIRTCLLLLHWTKRNKQWTEQMKLDHVVFAGF